MKITSINSTNQNYNCRKPEFKGYVNGKFYTDAVIDAAKDALKNPSWEQELRAKKVTFFKDYFNTLKDDRLTRIVGGIVSFGATEVVIAGLSALDTVSDKTEETINQIKNCMIDLLKKDNSES